jgi:hypothetical protein
MQNRPTEGYDLLESCLSTFDEGMDTIDVLESRSLMNEVAHRLS